MVVGIRGGVLLSAISLAAVWKVFALLVALVIVRGELGVSPTVLLVVTADLPLLVAGLLWWGCRPKSKRPQVQWFRMTCAGALWFVGIYGPLAGLLTKDHGIVLPFIYAFSLSLLCLRVAFGVPRPEVRAVLLGGVAVIACGELGAELLLPFVGLPLTGFLYALGFVDWAMRLAYAALVLAWLFAGSAVNTPTASFIVRGRSILLRFLLLVWGLFPITALL